MTELSRFDGELYFIARLKDHGAQIMTGVTDPTIRRERIRKAILDNGLDAVIFGRNRGTGKPDTYSQAFERFYGEPLKANIKNQALNT